MKKVIVIGGPTATGKTTLSVQLATKLNTEIISADSRQCYKELQIGVARPTKEQLSAIRHHFIASHSIFDEINAAGYEEYALAKVEDLFTHLDTIVMVGGTGLYIKAFTEGLDHIPSVDPSIRKEIISNYEQNGIGWLQEKVKEEDPTFYEKTDYRNPHRLMRALEVKLATGRSIEGFRTGRKKERDFEVEKIAIMMDMSQITANIIQRVDQMMEDGLLEEVISLYPQRHLNALQTVGYREFFEYLDGTISLDEAIELVKINTRQFAKRQITWFKKDPDFKWMTHSQFYKFFL